MATVFVSHSSKDVAFVAEELIPALESHGVGTWSSPSDLFTADEWERKIVAALVACEWFLVVLTPDSVTSDWVRAEVHWALGHRKGRVIPVLLVTCDSLDLHLQLPRIQHLDFRTDRQDALRKLLALWPSSSQGEAEVPPGPGRRYDPYPFAPAPPRLRDLPADARHLLLQAAHGESAVLETDWLETGEHPRLCRLRAGPWQEDIAESEDGADRWVAALGILEQRRLIQHVASRPGYRAYKVTPDGWDVAELVRQVRAAKPASR